MKKLIFVATALAVGMSAYAPAAWSQTAAAEAASSTKRYSQRGAPSIQPRNDSDKAAIATPSNPAAGAARRSLRGPSNVAPGAGDAAVTSVKPDVDETTTASIAPGKARSTGSGGSGYDAIIARYAAKHGLPVSLAHAVVRVESNYRANARGRAGEIGLMQIKPATARMMGYSGGAQGLYDPETNIRFGMRYLAKAHQLGGGDTCGTILRYNAGHGAKRMNKISAAYCAKVKRHMGGA